MDDSLYAFTPNALTWFSGLKTTKCNYCKYNIYYHHNDLHYDDNNIKLGKSAYSVKCPNCFNTILIEKLNASL